MKKMKMKMKMPVLQTIEQTQFDSIYNYIGLHSQFNEQKKKNIKCDQEQNFNENQDQIEEEEEKENQEILILWRFDEGKGKNIDNLSNYEQINNGEIISNNIENIWNQLEIGDPMEIEDEDEENNNTRTFYE
ncbi:hypothetical protein IMG5_105280 [Ichthyophthirius multifiliis]|uniref:Uncharacterized protein n=1 Tax=Ichthyophthirius multifiliis TaxID=5932 RepID=G0QT08_ICHMU|nr:hypothetical protein IMG5_105280 [Ichthyophthirius multifiliis]EGR31644.1 hypothetical protein IMG5_105280 [Ichthyophthirius multifiliis]|eukprot:XP_004035130.1 hypothetical protein IMG5_105280 [Ichthyophthirius multifiliis]